MNLGLTLLTIVSIGCVSCTKNNDSLTNNSSSIDPGNDPNFTIVANTDVGMTKYNRKVIVFGVDIYAAKNVEDAKLLYTANIMAQYLDNNEDGVVDNQLVVDKMVAHKAFLFMWKNQSTDFLDMQPSGRMGQDLGNDETHPSFVSSGRTGTFDAGLEEVWHIITNAGYAQAYPTIFGTIEGTSMSNAMDIARGGKFTTIPNPYPSNTWYTYNDQTCNYDCQGGEYIYWTMSSILGAQENRLNEISNEWKLNTKTKVQTTDIEAYGLLTNPIYKFPTILPDGTYMH